MLIVAKNGLLPRPTWKLIGFCAVITFLVKQKEQHVEIVSVVTFNYNCSRTLLVAVEYAVCWLQKYMHLLLLCKHALSIKGLG